ncbi:MAG: helix-turn-helix transcriptional regulator [Clostridia bacterium]|nr:helix-turn-helix transcriptional regulator [Clostridia bacterium]
MSDKLEPEKQNICPCSEACPIGDAVRMIGGRWKMRILCALTLDGTLRYNDIRKRITGITPAVLSASLKELEQDGLVSRTQYEEIPPRVEYAVTEHGKELWPILHSLAHWANRDAPEEKRDA